MLRSFAVLAVFTVGLPLASATPMIEAECWLDDDPDFDFGQTDGGTVYGQSSAQLNNACRELALARYGDQGSSRTRNAQPINVPSGMVQAECWLDDDPDFDFGQTDGGLSIGGSSLDLILDCKLAAELRFPDGSFGLRAADVVPGQATGIQAECWLDDDPDFDFGQTDGGTLFGASTYEIRTACQQLAEARYGADGSSGLRNVELTAAQSGFVSGTCWLDDDPDFDFGQVNAGEVIGRSSSELISECAYLADLRYGDQGSSGVKDVAPYPGDVTGFRAECWLDDDPDFDFGQVNGGMLYGQSTFEIRQLCQEIAIGRYGDRGSSGIKDVEGYSAASDLLVAECWIDDDPDFDHGQTHVGTLYAADASELAAECAYAAQQRYGDQGSYGLVDVEPLDEVAVGVRAECWLDDDPDFDFGQFEYGDLFGQSSFELRVECQRLAEDRYGADGSSGLKEISTY